eukprot:TRINITY_DN3254_c0_g1_i3.p1 TRINITY_DN3254_c0_g1~~TRINITY_DN3254_c0_g1_i3.p1  ORF type:complete len:161 (-),score=56.20 TRINITY_DN3254_c0_g1_i3:52-534(-)
MAFAAFVALQSTAFVGALGLARSSREVGMEAAKKAATTKKAATSKKAAAAKKAPPVAVKAMSKTARIEEVVAKLNEDGEEVSKKTVQKVLMAYFESVAEEVKDKGVADLHGYISVRKVTKPAVKAGKKMMVAGREITTKAKPAETKVSANLKKALKDAVL